MEENVLITGISPTRVRPVARKDFEISQEALEYITRRAYNQMTRNQEDEGQLPPYEAKMLKIIHDLLFALM